MDVPGQDRQWDPNQGKAPPEGDSEEEYRTGIGQDQSTHRLGDWELRSLNSALGNHSFLINDFNCEKARYVEQPRKR